jgi:hypothetical protein
MIGFIANSESWPSLWLPMGMLNIWRIPFLFFVSGMGVYFAMQQRTLKQLLQERALRILLPFVFGTFCIFPISVALWQYYYKWDIVYAFNPGHLWFLGNIFVYVVVLAPVFYYMKKNAEGKFVRGLKKVLGNPLGLLPVIGIFIAEVMVMKPNPYELYAIRYRSIFFFLALGLYIFRLVVLEMRAPGYLLVIESDCWIFSMFAFGYRYLNRPGKVLSYLSQAAYPVYILHMIFLFLGSLLIFPLDMPIQLEFVLLLMFTFVGCFAAFEGVKQINILRPLFGIKMKSKSKVVTATTGLVQI